MAEKWAVLMKTGPNDGLAVVWAIHFYSFFFDTN